MVIADMVGMAAPSESAGRLLLGQRDRGRYPMADGRPTPVASGRTADGLSGLGAIGDLEMRPPDVVVGPCIRGVTSRSRDVVVRSTFARSDRVGPRGRST